MGVSEIISQQESQIRFYKDCFKNMIKQRDEAQVALRDIRDGKDNPSYLTRKVVGETMWRDYELELRSN